MKASDFPRESSKLSAAHPFCVRGFELTDVICFRASLGDEKKLDWDNAEELISTLESTGSFSECLKRLGLQLNPMQVALAVLESRSAALCTILLLRLVAPKFCICSPEELASLMLLG
jgi:hypothetical protein